MINRAYVRYRVQCERSGLLLPQQNPRGGNRQLDRQVINYTVGILEQQGEHIGAIRGVFQEGEPIFPGSALYNRSHIQIAVRDNALISDVWQIDETGRRIE